MKRMYALSVFAVTLAVVGLVGCGTVPPSSGDTTLTARPLPSDKIIIENFMLTGLGWNDRSDELGFILKFPGSEIDYAVHPSARMTTDQEKELNKQLARISAATGLTFHRTDLPRHESSNDQPNLILFIGGAPERQAAANYHVNGLVAGDTAGTCFVRPAINFQSGEIERAVVFIDSSGGDWLFLRCLDEELMQSLGLMRDLPPGTDYSVFVDLDGSPRATRHDYVLLRILYDQRIRSRMPPNAVRFAAQTVLPDAKAAVLALWPR